MKLGKLTPRHDKRTLQLANYLAPELFPSIPAARDWSKSITQWGMMGNDWIGDCTTAAAGHSVQTWSGNATNEVTISDEEVIKAYSDVTGYDPESGANDNGAVMLDVLNYWRQKGIGGHSITGYAALEPENTKHVGVCVYLFGLCYIGLAMPLSAQMQTVWSVPPGGPHGWGAPGSWGGHCVIVVGYDSHGLLVVTWGALKRITWGFYINYCDESYGLISTDWLKASGVSPAGLDIATMKADITRATSGAIKPTVLVIPGGHASL